VPLLRVVHGTTYRYAAPVSFGPHRMMVRPRDSHDLRIIATRLSISPEPRSVRWVYDVFGNSIAIAEFSPETQATELRFDSELDLVHYVSDRQAYPVEDYAHFYPFSYAVEEVPDLARSIERHYPDPDRIIDRWARGFVRIDGPTSTLDMLVLMTETIRSTFRYETRFEEGTQLPVETLRLGSGTCRDFALLMMEAVRALGFAARFVTGYIYSPDAGGTGNIGGGATHAWLEIYLPGAGWMSFDPTNGIVGNRDLIRVAVVRDPRQALPLVGTWFGAAGDYIGVWVGVDVTETME
jgi:transglutaminase-like putative cysteine protease